MPHTPATHVTITPKHVYINGEPINVIPGYTKLGTPSPTDIQAIQLTITPTTVTILNDDNPDAISAAREAVTRSTRDDADNPYSIRIHADYVDHMIDTLKQYKATQTQHAQH